MQSSQEWITLRLLRVPHSATRTHCLCRQANSGHHCHFSSMYSPHTPKTRCSLENFWPVNFSKASARAWFVGERRISEDLRLSYTMTLHKSPHLHWSLGRLPVYPTGTAFHSIPSSDSASEAPLYPESDHKATDPKTSVRSAAQETAQQGTSQSRETLYINRKPFEVPQ